jgi:ADP-heptose:LPS heptosyltransferase
MDPENHSKLLAKKHGVPEEQITRHEIPLSAIGGDKEFKVQHQPASVRPPNVFQEPPSPDEIAEQRIYAFNEHAKELHKYADTPLSDAEKRLQDVGRPLRDTNPETAVKRAVDVTNKAVLSTYMEKNPKGTGTVLKKRPPGAPSILEECQTPIRLRIIQHQSPGDIIMLTAAVRDLHASYPGVFKTEFKTTCKEVWQHNPNATKFTKEEEASVMSIYCKYDLINSSNKGAHHFIHGFRKDLEDKLGIPITQGLMKGDIHISAEEKRWRPQVKEILDKDVPYWIIDAGHKHDFTCKMWEHARYQQVVDRFKDITFVQIGKAEKRHTHKPLTGDNVINLVGKTDLRQMCRLMYHAAGVITPVSMPMHMAAAIEMKPEYGRKKRPCIVIAGGREPAVWEAYTAHQFMHTCGQLPCCEEGGCWASRVEPLFDGDAKDTTKLCSRPVTSTSGQVVPQCMDMITVDQVCTQIQAYLMFYDYKGDKSAWRSKSYMMPADIRKKRDDARKHRPGRTGTAAAKKEPSPFTAHPAKR